MTAWATLALLVLSACSDPKAGAPPPPPLVRIHVVDEASGGPLELRGSVAAESRIRLGFKQPGVIAEILVREGDAVRQGQLVARLDDVDARSHWRMAVAARDKAKRDAERAANLAEEGAVATGARDDAVSQLEAAEAQAAQAQDALERTRLTAPATGTVFARTAEPGETVGAGMPILLLDTTGALLVRAGATERELRSLNVGQAVSLVPDEGGPTFTGRVQSVATTPNPADGLYAVEVRPAAAAPLRPGGLVRMGFEARATSRHLRMPLEALVHRQDRDFVFVLDPEDRVRQRAIVVERAEGHDVVVRSGLTGGERIVAEGAYFLQDGQTVRLLRK